MKYLLGCDIGSGGIRTVLMNENLIIVSQAEIKYAFSTPKPRWVEQDPIVYWDSFAKTTKMIFAQSGIEASEVTGIAISGLCPSCIPIDENIYPLGPAIIWLDRRATEESLWLQQRIGKERIFKVTGNEADPYCWIAKVLWQKNHTYKVYDRAYKFLPAKDFVTAKLTGETATDFASATLGGVVFDIRRRMWSQELLDYIGIDGSKLPTPYSADKIIGDVTHEASEKTDLREGTVVCAGTDDGVATIFSTGVIEEGENGIVMGTAGDWGVVHQRDIFTPGMVCLPNPFFMGTSGYMTVGTLAGGGAAYEWLRRKLWNFEGQTKSQSGFLSYQRMEAEAEKVPLGSEGLFVLPYFDGSGSPSWDPFARGVIFGLTLRHGRGHIVRSFLEAMAFDLLQCKMLVERQGVSVRSRASLTGGGARSKLFRQILADVLGMEIVYSPDDGAAIGSCFLAGKATGILKDYSMIKKRRKTECLHTPDWKRHKVYQELYRIYLNIYPRLKDLYPVLAEGKLNKE